LLCPGNNCFEYDVTGGLEPGHGTPNSAFTLDQVIGDIER
jgi:hypothetical protein